MPPERRRCDTVTHGIPLRVGRRVDAVLARTRRWHELCLADPMAAHPFEHGLHPRHDERLAAYLAEAVGGPALYTAGFRRATMIQRA